MMLPGGVLPWDTLEAMSARIAAWGWNINLQLDGRELPQHLPLLKRLESLLVIDHTGKFLEPVAPDSEAFRALLELVDGGRCWVTLSPPYETSREGLPHYGVVGRLARILATNHPQRCLWASNWPYPNQNPVPSSQTMLPAVRVGAGRGHAPGDPGGQPGRPLRFLRSRRARLCSSWMS